MRGIDTNLIVRYLTGVHPKQSAKARALIDGEDVFVATIVIGGIRYAIPPYALMRRLQGDSQLKPGS